MIADAQSDAVFFIYLYSVGAAVFGVFLCLDFACYSCLLVYLLTVFGAIRFYLRG